MNNQIFEHWIRKLDRKFSVDEKKVAVIIDGCPAHLPISKLTNIELIFLHPNTMSILQSMGQGAIKSLKGHYQR